MGLFEVIGRIATRIRLFATGWGAVSGPEYHHFRNVIVPTSRGTSEIDHLIVSPFGLFVIEDKRRSGLIFAKASDRHWTAVHSSGNYRFQNPLHQNFGHVKALEEYLSLDPAKMHPAVVFRGGFQFETPVPDGVFLDSCATWVASKQEVLIDKAELDRIVDALREGTSSGFFATRDHAASVRAKYESTNTCPKCGGDLKPRVARGGPMPGSPFLGCSRYPKCKYIRDLSD